MKIKKFIVGMIASLFLTNVAIAATSTSYKIDVDSLNGGGDIGSSANYKLNDTITGFVNGLFGNSANYTLGSGLVYLETLCGNGIVEFGETCDDGNIISGDGCSGACRIENICGNGITEMGEQCDDGNLANGDGCSSACSTESSGGAMCGNGRLESGEQCDDGNLTNGDGCSYVCANEVSGGGYLPVNVCGNNKVEAGEECDDGNKISGDGCSNKCAAENAFRLSSCGNGIQETGEECDDGNETSGDGCSSACKLTGAGGIPVRTIKIIVRPEKRVNADKNWATSGSVSFYNLALNKFTLITNADINSVGWSEIKTNKLADGNYAVAFKGRSHLTKIIRQVKIDKDIQTIDFSSGGAVYLIAGDVNESKDDFINGLDIAAIAKMLYSPDIGADLNGDGTVNGLDISIAVGNLYKSGEKIQI